MYIMNYLNLKGKCNDDNDYKILILTLMNEDDDNSSNNTRDVK